MTNYLIVGGGLASVYASQAIREHDKAGKITLVSEEMHLPYDRVPLSKGYLVGKVKEESLFPRKRDFFEDQKIVVITGRRIASLDPVPRVVRLEDRSELPFDRLLLATGGKPRTLPLPGSDLKGIYYLRTLDDCDSIKQEMLLAKKAVVVGGGFIGCELAAAFITKGVETTIVEAAPSLLSLAFDPDTAKWIEGYFISMGAKVMTNAQAAEFVGEGGRVTGVKTKDGTFVAGDFVVVGVGIVPSTELAEQAGLKVDRGIVVDEFLETSIPNIFAAGDVARFYHSVFGHHLRVEHYDTAVKHGKLAGGNMAGDKQPFTEMPYFFSYMFDLTIKAYGDMSRRDAMVRRGELGTKGFFQFFFADGKLQAFLSLNRPNEEIKAARSILLRRPGLNSVQSISDDSKSLQEFMTV